VTKLNWHKRIRGKIKNKKIYGTCVSHVNVWGHWSWGNTCGLLCEPMVVVFCATKIFLLSAFSQGGACWRRTPNIAPMTFFPLSFPPCLEIHATATTTTSTKTLVIHSVLNVYIQCFLLQLSIVFTMIDT